MLFQTLDFKQSKLRKYEISINFKRFKQIIVFKIKLFIFCKSVKNINLLCDITLVDICNITYNNVLDSTRDVVLHPEIFSPFLGVSSVMSTRSKMLKSKIRKKKNFEYLETR